MIRMIQRTKLGKNLGKLYTTYIPSKPTWDLIQSKAFEEIKLNDASLRKLEKLSMLTIDSRIEKDLNDAINVVSRIGGLDTANVKPLIYFDYLGVCELREDNVKLESNLSETNLSTRLHRESIMQNSKYKFEEYYVAPPTKIETQF